MGFKSVGENVAISTKASFYGVENISIGNHIRIDDFCILSGNITIGNYVHVAAYSALFGGREGIEIRDFANISSRVTVYALTDDYSGETMTSPLIPEQYKNVTYAKVQIGRHVIIGASSVVLPGAVLNEGASFGAFSLIKGNIEGWTMNAGIPCKTIKPRKKDLLELEKRFQEEIGVSKIYPKNGRNRQPTGAAGRSKKGRRMSALGTHGFTKTVQRGNLFQKLEDYETIKSVSGSVSPEQTASVVLNFSGYEKEIRRQDQLFHLTKEYIENEKGIGHRGGGIHWAPCCFRAIGYGRGGYCLRFFF